MGFTASEIGNPDLKPNFVFRHDESEPFIQLKLRNHTIKMALKAIEKALASKSISKKRVYSPQKEGIQNSESIAVKREPLIMRKSFVIPEDVKQRLQ